MSASIKATCPNCRKLIRIPLDWSDRAMKCKKCGTLVQMKKKDTSPTVVAETTATAPAMPQQTYEPNFDLPPQPAFEPPPAYEAAPHPYGYPSPYPMPPQYGAPAAYSYPQSQPPAYGYPQPSAYAPPQYAPPVTHESSVFPVADDASLTRRKYTRGSSNTTTKIVMFAILAMVLGGMVMIGMKLSKRFTDSGSQVRLDQPAKGGSPDADPQAGTGTNTGTTPAIVSDPFPRRMLFMHISKYVYFNNLSAGVYGRGEDLPTATASKMAYEFRVPTEGANNQLFVLSDTSGKTLPPMLKDVMLQTFERFFTTCREQDRIIVYFSGHAREVDGKAYLVPVDGDPEDPSTLLPLAEVYARLAACKAQQKILLWDVCRFNPGVGSARAGSEPMSEALQTALHAVPPGVQVMTSCSAGQNAQETIETGSEFLTAFNVKLRQLKMSGASLPVTPGQPIPIEKWSDMMREYLASKREFAPSQTVRATIPALANNLAYDKSALPAPMFSLPFVAPGANPGDVQKLLSALTLPGIRKEIELPPGLAAVYPFSADVMKAYTADDDANTPLRKATLAALAYIRDQWKFGDGGGLRESLNGSVDETVKKEIAEAQIPIARLELELSEHMHGLEAAGKKLVDEKSKKWQGLYAYALAQLQLRWAFVNEYNLALGTIRTDGLEPPMGGGTPIYRLVSVDKMKSKKDYTERVEIARESFEKIAKDHKGTPFEILAKMNRNVSLGLTWKLDVQQVEDKKE